MRSPDATARYLARHVTAEHLADPQMITKLDHDADGLIRGPSKEAARPALFVHIGRATDPAGNARFDEGQVAHTAPSGRHDDSRRPYQKPGQRLNRPAAPGR